MEIPVSYFPMGIPWKSNGNGVGIVQFGTRIGIGIYTQELARKPITSPQTFTVYSVLCCVTN